MLQTGLARTFSTENRASSKPVTTVAHFGSAPVSRRRIDKQTATPHSRKPAAARVLCRFESHRQTETRPQGRQWSPQPPRRQTSPQARRHCANSPAEAAAMPCPGSRSGAGVDACCWLVRPCSASSVSSSRSAPTSRFMPISNWDGDLPFLTLLVAPAGFALMAWICRRYFPGAQGSGIPRRSPLRSRRSPRTQQAAVGENRFRQGIADPRRLALRRRGRPRRPIGAGRRLDTPHPGGQALRSHRTDARPHRTAGGAAGIAAAFNTPLGGIMFAIEGSRAIAPSLPTARPSSP